MNYGIFRPDSLDEPEIVIDLAPLAREIVEEDERSTTVVIPGRWLDRLREQCRNGGRW